MVWYWQDKMACHLATLNTGMQLPPAPQSPFFPLGVWLGLINKSKHQQQQQQKNIIETEDFFGSFFLLIVVATTSGTEISSLLSTLTYVIHSDISGGYSPSMFNAMRVTLHASRTLKWTASDPNYRQLTHHEAFYLATMGGAQGQSSMKNELHR